MIYARLETEGQDNMFRVCFTCTQEEWGGLKKTIMENLSLWRKEGWHHGYKKNTRLTHRMHMYNVHPKYGISGYSTDNALHIVNRLGFTPVSEKFFYKQ